MKEKRWFHHNHFVLHNSHTSTHRRHQEGLALGRKQRRLHTGFTQTLLQYPVPGQLPEHMLYTLHVY